MTRFENGSGAWSNMHYRTRITAESAKKPRMLYKIKHLHALRVLDR